ncbi:MAG: nicotinamide-nucleotide amidohydrolase family protein [Clostridia bacterium]|nr:nicotinamide-nucleotide amidohydrolase family protein [Clostridia bacterium]
MKTVMIAFDDFNAEKARRAFADGGVAITTVLKFAADDDMGFKRGYETFRDLADAIVIADGAAFDLKQMVADFTETVLIENENARKTLENNGFKEFSGALMPLDATFIPNAYGEYQGFVYEEREFTLIVLPSAEKEFASACEKYVIPYLSAKVGFEKRMIFKCFGDKYGTEETLNSVKDRFDFDYSVRDDNGDLTVSVFFKDNNDAEYRVAVREIFTAIKDVCYADCDVSLSETLFTLLKLGGKKISVAESFTGGKVAAELIKNSGVSEYLIESVVAYSDKSKEMRLGVPAEEIKTFGAVSAKVAYRMAAGLIRSGSPDIAVATTGIAGPNGDGTDAPVGRCFIAVGTKGGIHTYKFDFTGNREEITEKGVNAALFYAVKTIKNL